MQIKDQADRDITKLKGTRRRAATGWNAVLQKSRMTPTPATNLGRALARPAARIP